MKKIYTTLLTAILLASLTGCSTSDNDSTPSDSSSGISKPVSGDSNSGSNNSESSNSENSSSDTSAPVGNEITAQFETPNGEPAELTNAVVTNHEGGEIPLSEMTKDNWAYVTCDYVYLAEPQGIYYDSVKNADIFDEKELKFTGAPETVSYKYKKYKVGDSFGELKVTHAITSFFPEWFNSKPKYFNGGSVLFEGTLTLTGKCRLAPETEGYITARDIAFIPDANSCKLPIMDYFTDENGNVPLCAGMTNGVCWLSEYPAGISLGNADGYPDFDFSEFPEDGSFVDVQVTIDKILLRNELNFTNTFNAKIVDIKLI